MKLTDEQRVNALHRGKSGLHPDGLRNGFGKLAPRTPQASKDHRAHFVLEEADRFPTVVNKKDVFAAIGDGHAHQLVALDQGDK